MGLLEMLEMVDRTVRKTPWRAIRSRAASDPPPPPPPPPPGISRHSRG